MVIIHLTDYDCIHHPPSDFCFSDAGNFYRDSENFYCCPVCHKKYRRKGAVMQHKRYECNQDPKFECYKCHKKFKQRSNLYSHVSAVHKEMIQREKGIFKNVSMTSLQQ